MQANLTRDGDSGLFIPGHLANRKMKLRKDWAKRWQLGEGPCPYTPMQGGMAALFVRSNLAAVVAREPFLNDGSLGYHLIAFKQEGRKLADEDVERARWDLIPHGVAFYEVHPPLLSHQGAPGHIRHLWETRAPGVVQLADRVSKRRGEPAP